jgi:hypothetical protein
MSLIAFLSPGNGTFEKIIDTASFHILRSAINKNLYILDHCLTCKFVLHYLSAATEPMAIETNVFINQKTPHSIKEVKILIRGTKFYRSLLFLIRIYSNVLAPLDHQGIVFPFFLTPFRALSCEKTEGHIEGVCFSADFHLKYPMKMGNLKSKITGRQR